MTPEEKETLLRNYYEHPCAKTAGPAIDALRKDLAHANERIREWTEYGEKWREEARRLRTPEPPTTENVPTLSTVIDWLEHHRFTHHDWASWFEQNPDDPRGHSDIGNAEFHRKVERRYDLMIAAVKEADRELSDARAAVQAERKRCAEIARELFNEPLDETRAHDVGFAIANAIERQP